MSTTRADTPDTGFPTEDPAGVPAGGGPDGTDGTPELVAGYLSRISRKALLSPQEEKDLARRARRGDGRAFEMLVEKNLRLVVSVAKKYRGMGLPFEDLIQEGNIGLIRAAGKFDPDRGNRFSTYAVWWIRQAVGRAVVNTGRTIRLPNHAHEKLRRTLRARNELSLRLGREPTEKELSEKLGWSVERVRWLLDHPSEPASLDRPLQGSYGENGSELGHLIQDEKASDTSDAVVREVELEALRDVLESLPERPRYVLARRYGLRNEPAATLREISEELGISRERVRQLQTEAERTLKIRYSKGEASKREQASKDNGREVCLTRVSA